MFRTKLLLAGIVAMSCFFKAHAQVNNPRNQIVFQAFWWDYWNSNYPNGWANYLTELAPRLKTLGVDAVWIPPTVKNTGTNSVGYAPFDHYDLGDKYQKGSVKTRMGDKDELLRMMAVMKANGIDVIQDVVLNHVTGAGSSTGAGGQDPSALDDGATNRYKNFRYTSFLTPASAETATNYLSRSGRFSKNWENFYPNNNNVCCTNDINSPFWGPDVSYESDAYGLSSNAVYNPAQFSDYMRSGARNWLIWYKKQMGWDGVRFDAVKHFPSYVAEDFLWNLEYGALWASEGADMFAVGEWVGGTTELDAWANNVQNRAGTFDFGLRSGLLNVIQGGGLFDLGTVPNYQQQNRYRTVPFVNNHDTYRPTVDASGNYTGWDTGNELAPHIEPNDVRSSIVYAIALSVDGAPQLFFEDIFNLGYLGNRYTHSPSDTAELPIRSDLENLVWCHQNLHFKSGAYLVRWQAADALVIERETNAIIAVNDNYSSWQYLTGVQTAWPDGTVLRDYSGANTGTFTVYGGGKMDIAIPPCDGTALHGRRGYCVWGVDGINTNYARPAERITQEWEMADDLGDSHPNSLQQGGKLPANSTDCRIVGRIFPQAGEVINVELYPEDTSQLITLFIQDKNCATLDSITQAGVINFAFTPTESAWHTMKIKNATATQAGQKAWVKVNYLAPEVVQTNVTKNKCACETVSFAGINETDRSGFVLSPNPGKDQLTVDFNAPAIENGKWTVRDAAGRIMKTGDIASGSLQITLNIADLTTGIYFLEIGQGTNAGAQPFVKE